MRLYSKIFWSLILLFTFMNHVDFAFAEGRDSAEFILKVNKKVDAPVKFVIQYHKSDTVNFAIKDMYSSPKYINTRVIQKKSQRVKSFKDLRRSLGNTKKCDYEKTLKVRYIDPLDLACDVIKPLSDEGIRYSHIADDSYLDALSEGLVESGWVRVDSTDQANLVIFVELEITNLVNVMKLGLRARLSSQHHKLKKYDPLHLLGLRVTGINLDKKSKEKLLFKTYLVKALLNAPSEKTLDSLMDSAGQKIGKQKSYGYLRGHAINFRNYEEVDK